MAGREEHGDEIPVTKAKLDQEDEPRGEGELAGPSRREAKGNGEEADGGPNEKEFPKPCAKTGRNHLLR